MTSISAAGEPLDWPGDWLRGVLDVCVLRILADGPTYGYAVAVRLGSAGLGSVKGGTLYPLLLRLERAELVTVEWRAGEGGPGRKYYALTEAGRAELTATSARWQLFAELTAAFVTSAPVTSGSSPSTSSPSTSFPNSEQEKS